MEERALKTLKEILTARGFQSETFDSVGSSIDQTKMYTFGGVLIIFSTKSRVAERDLNTFIEFSKENGYSHGTIIVSMATSSETVVSALRQYISNPENPIVQIFDIRHLQFNITKHVKVPKHRIVPPAEVAGVLKECNVETPSLFRKLDSQDAMAKWIGARPADIIEVTGMCETSGENKHYLYCVANVKNGQPVQLADTEL
uniref:RNA polymerase subunit H/Rpb5 C-terminal domain-containing protein n=1 Tax=viral metagenome TaxID=1070528 RepID=A0A6C0JVH3_9ZZZZ